MATKAKPSEAPAEKSVKVDEPVLEVGSPEWKRADYVRALNEEREQCVNAGKSDRVKAIDAEIKRASKPVERQAPPSDEA